MFISSHFEISYCFDNYFSQSQTNNPRRPAWTNFQIHHNLVSNALLLLIQVAEEINCFVVAFIFHLSHSNCCRFVWWIAWIRRHFERLKYSDIWTKYFHHSVLNLWHVRSDRYQFSRATENCEESKKEMIAMETEMIMRRWYTFNFIVFAISRSLCLRKTLKCKFSVNAKSFTSTSCRQFLLRLILLSDFSIFVGRQS